MLFYQNKDYELSFIKLRNDFLKLINSELDKDAENKIFILRCGKKSKDWVIKKIMCYIIYLLFVVFIITPITFIISELAESNIPDLMIFVYQIGIILSCFVISIKFLRPIFLSYNPISCIYKNRNTYYIFCVNNDKIFAAKLNSYKPLLFNSIQNDYKIYDKSIILKNHNKKSTVKFEFKFYSNNQEDTFVYDDIIDIYYKYRSPITTFIDEIEKNIKMKYL